MSPYTNAATNLIYNLLYCDSMALLRAHTPRPWSYPYDILFKDNSSVNDLQRIIDDPNTDARLKLLACTRQQARGHKPAKRELLGVVVEVGLDEGLDTLAAYSDGSARYINYSGRLIIWESRTEESDRLIRALLDKSWEIVLKIGVWDKPRRPPVPRGSLRLSFLVSDGLYFGEGPMHVMFNDPMAGPALTSAMELMKYLTEKQ